MPRPQGLPSLLLAGSLAAGLFIVAPHQRAHADDSCLSGPQGATPAGRHWRYHIEAGTKRHCWYLGDAHGKTAQAPAAKQPKATASTASSDVSSAAPTASSSQPPAQPLQPIVANARAEMANAANAGDDTVASPSPGPQPSSDTTNSAPPPGPSNSTVDTRWPDPSKAMGLAQASVPPTPATAAPKPDSQLLGERTEAGPTIPAVAAAALQASPYSMPMLLGGLAGALAFAGLLGFGVIKFGNLHRIRRTAPRQESLWEESDDASMLPWQPRDLDAEPHRPQPRPRGNPPPPRSRREIEAASRDIMNILSKASRETAG